MTAAEKLAEFNLSLEDAYNWIVANLSSPGEIFNTAQSYGINSKMLAEIVSPLYPGVTATEVESFFTSHGLNGGLLSAESGVGDTGGGSGGSSSLSGLEDKMLQLIQLIVAPNTASGALSTESLKQGVLTSEVFLFDPNNPTSFGTTTITAEQYDTFFNDSAIDSNSDGTLTPNELGFAFAENLQQTYAGDSDSLFYGTLINIFKSIDQEEINQLENISPNLTDEQLIDLSIGIYEDQANPPLFADTELANVIVLATANAIGLAGTDGFSLNFDTGSLIG